MSGRSRFGHPLFNLATSELHMETRLRQACICQPLHSGCDPRFCENAVSAPLPEWIEHGGPLGLFEIDGQWEKGAAEGCVTCGAILAAGGQVLKLYKHGSHQLSYSSGRNAASPVSFAVTRELGKFQVSKNTNMLDFVLLLKKTDLTSSNQCQAIPYSTGDSFSTESDTAFDFCKVRLRECIETHTACKNQCLYTYPLPKRVVDIGYRDQKLSNGQEDSFHPHLLELGHGQSREYVTLSHCWGQKQIITTTKTTLASRLQSIPWSWLSKTFQDAVCITHKLGYQYIWIDSLCIIQDDELDWQTESKKMASTYQNSIFTIAASKSANGSGGCFTPTPGLMGEELCHPYTGVPTGITWRKSMNHLVDPPPHWTGFDFNTWDWPLSLRAWTLQEELLSPRVIYYGPNELLWQCNTTFNCQCGEFRGAIPFNSSWGHLNKAEFSVALDTEQWKSISAAKHQRILEIQWANIVTQYSMRQMTRETDRFPAISGLAKQIQTAGLAPLVAGIPANNVLPWLLWDSDAPTRRQSVYIAPSWSWASFNCISKIYFLHPYLSQPKLSVKSEPIAQVVDIIAEPAGLDPTGAVQSGHLVLYSHAFRVVLKYLTSEIINEIFPERTIKLYMHCLGGREDVVHSSGIDYAEDKQNLVGQDLLCVLICRIMGLSPDDFSLETYGLVLAPAEGSLYRRVGWCHFESSDEFPPDYELREVTII